MPPKKAAAALGANGADGKEDKATPFKWDQETDYKLLSFITTIRTVSKDEHEQLAKILGVPSAGGVRNRIDKLRKDLKTAHADAGFTAPEVTPKTPTKPKKTSAKGTPKATPKGKKRGASAVADEDADGDDVEDVKLGKKIKVAADDTDEEVKEELKEEPEE